MLESVGNCRPSDVMLCHGDAVSTMHVIYSPNDMRLQNTEDLNQHCPRCTGESVGVRTDPARDV